MAFPTEFYSVGAQTPLDFARKLAENWWGALAPVLDGWVTLMANYYITPGVTPGVRIHAHNQWPPEKNSGAASLSFT